MQNIYIDLHYKVYSIPQTQHANWWKLTNNVYIFFLQTNSNWQM